MFNVTNFNRFLLVVFLACNAFTSIYRITVLHILHFIPKVKDLYQLLYTVPFTLKAASFMGGLQPR